MAPNLKINTPHGEVSAALVDAGSAMGILLAHGAGAGQAHPWMAGMRDAITSFGITTMTFDYAYIEAGRRAPDRLPKLLDVHQAVFDFFGAEVGSVVLAGKSMGGRVGGHLATDRDAEVGGVIYYGYPLVAIGKTEARDTGHLDALATRQLFVSGDRDRMGPIDKIRNLADRVPDGELVIIESGDHSFTPLKSSGRSLEDAIHEAARATESWLNA